MEYILKIENLTKHYEKVIALDDISLEIEKGSIFGLLGPNGAGKTSLIRIITGINLPDSGSFVLNNISKNFEELSKILGYLPEERGLYTDMKIRDQLEFLGKLKGLQKQDCKKKINYYSERLGIIDWLDKKVIELSKGMQQLVQFVATIFFEPLLLILDEPFTGLDPINTNIMKKEILALKEKGCTIIFSTHRMEQVEEICENIALIDKGKILLNGKITEIKNKFKKNIYKIEYLNNFQVNDLEIELLEKLDENSILIKNNFADKSPSHLLKRLISQSEIKSFIEILPSLNEIFIESVQKKDVSNLENGE